MLEADEFDDDFFTPVASASLANIFGKSATDERSENESLKYTSKPQNVNQQLEETKTTSCVFACALVGYEWLNNAYSQKRKLGFALIKILKTESHNIILYNSNKSTLSNTSVTSKLKVTVKRSNYISYYDDQSKYWSLFGEVNEIKKITDLLKMLDVTINTSTETDENLPEPVKNKEVIAIQEGSKNKAESDTDSSINKKTKASILNRMANMGHSVLPPNTMPANKTSDSSDTNDTDHNIKAVRHKPTKGTLKRNSTDKMEHQQIIIENPRIGYTTEMKNTSSFISDQLVPLASTSIVPNPGGNDMNLFITEQRICNSELRINMGRVSDKVDHLVNKINNLEFKDPNAVTANLNTEILHKLLREYENKIKVYEELFKKMRTEDMNTLSVTVPINIESSHETEALQNKIEEFKNITNQKDQVISSLQNEIQILKDAKEQQNNDLQKKISILEENISSKDYTINELNEKLKQTCASREISNKMRSVMNETYQAIASNFENTNTYSGESINRTIAKVIREITLRTLNEPD